MKVLLQATVAAIAIGLTVVGALVQGSYSNRWSEDTELQLAGERVASIPTEVAGWELIKTKEFEKKVVDILQCGGYINRIYRNKKSGQPVTVALIVGPSGPTSVHIPEICYSSKQYDIEGRSKSFAVERDDHSDTFWGVSFRSLDPGVGLLQVAYAWGADGEWRAEKNPRITLRHHSVLYKIQVAATLSPGATSVNDSACKEFLEAFLPVVDAAIEEAVETGEEDPS